jgi:membrane fusion protein, peptide pheromone/bacteriocin exporter
MKEELFPKEIIENTQESNFSTHSVKSRVIYSVIVLSLISLIAILPLVVVDVGVRSHGIIRPVTEIIQLSSPVSGPVRYINAVDNSYVTKDQVIAIIDSPSINEKLRFIQSRKYQLSEFIGDIDELQRVNPDFLQSDIGLNTARYQRSLLEFRQQLINQHQIVDQQARILERENILHSRNATSRSALEEIQYRLQSEKNRLNLILEQQTSSWYTEKLAFQDELQELTSEFVQLTEERLRYEIKSPVSGTLQNTSGITENGFVFVNQVMGEISPDTNLVAEVYISPGDIGLLREGLPVRFQIDAFNHHQWGIATGTVKSISRDILIIENKPVFKVKCDIDQEYLELVNGFKGQIVKGMTFQARFIISRRSLLQLLYDKVDDWLNPAWAENKYAHNRPTL